MIGKTLGRYRVLEKIGRGGMGEVFLAEDTSLHRRVALKFLPPDMQQDAEASKRFIREAQSAAALDHPYICHINEVAESEGRNFIVMEYVEGQALRGRIAQGPLPLEDALQVGIEVAEALEAAHGKGIVHRDIKPENIMLTKTGLASYAHFLMIMDRQDEAFAKIERALELDPHNIMVQSFYAQVLLGARRYDDAIAVARKVLSLQPNTGVAITALIGALFKKGLYEELLVLDKESWAKDPELLHALELGYGETGYPGAMKKFADVLAARYGKPGGPRAIILSLYLAQAGDKERVIPWLNKAYEEHDNNMAYIGADPIFDLARDDPRFQDLVRRVGLPPLKPAKTS